VSSVASLFSVSARDMLRSYEGSNDVLLRLLPQFLWRIVNYKEIDIQFTLSQFRNLLRDPEAVFKAARFHQQTQGRWARDDPGFLVVEVACVVVAAIVYFLALEPFSLVGFVMAVLWTLVHFFAVACCMASLGYWLATTYMLKPDASSSDPSFGRGAHGGTDGVAAEEAPRIPTTTSFSSSSPSSSSASSSSSRGTDSVEWWYCFDVHCNSFFPYFVFTRIAQFVLLPVIYADSMVVVVLSGLLYFAGFAAYIYVTFLGYFALQFLQHTEKLLLWWVGNSLWAGGEPDVERASLEHRVGGACLPFVVGAAHAAHRPKVLANERCGDAGTGKAGTSLPAPTPTLLVVSAPGTLRSLWWLDPSSAWCFASTCRCWRSSRGSSEQPRRGGTTRFASVNIENFCRKKYQPSLCLPYAAIHTVPELATGEQLYAAAGSAEDRHIRRHTRTHVPNKDAHTRARRMRQM
jgi:hypothetical protein